MLDIVEIQDGKDLGVADTAVTKAANVLSIQLGSLEYAPDFGVDLRFFLTSNLQFQNDSFKAYLVDRLTHSQVNVSDVRETLEALFSRYTFFVGDASESMRGFIR